MVWSLEKKENGQLINPFLFTSHSFYILFPCSLQSEREANSKIVHSPWRSIALDLVMKPLLLKLGQRRYMRIYHYSSVSSGKAFGGCSWQLSVLINSSKMHSVHSEGRNSAAIIMRRVAITNTLHKIKKRKHKY